MSASFVTIYSDKGSDHKTRPPPRGKGLLQGKEGKGKKSHSSDTGSTSWSSQSSQCVSYSEKKCKPVPYDNCGGGCRDANVPCGPCGTSGPYEPNCFEFQVGIYPLNQMVPQNSGVKFQMRRKSGVVFLQWENFSGSIGQSGVSHLTVNQSICNLPPFLMKFPIMISYKSVQKITYIQIDPNDPQANIKIFLNADGTGTGILQGDAVNVYSCSISWIVECC